jgi:hypothetical protein
MKMFNYTKLSLLIITVLCLIFFPQCSSVTETGNPDYTLSSDDPVLAKQGTGELTDQEKADLLFIREEEKLARDMYNFLWEKWGLSIFAKIAPSEQNHMDAVKRLIDTHNLTDIDPVVIQPEPGLFVNEDIQALYDELEANGILSETDALKVGVIIENTDIEDLELFLTRVYNRDIINVYQNLADGSSSHLIAFESHLP